MGDTEIVYAASLSEHHSPSASENADLEYDEEPEEAWEEEEGDCNITKLPFLYSSATLTQLGYSYSVACRRDERGHERGACETKEGSGSTSLRSSSPSSSGGTSVVVRDVRGAPFSLPNSVTVLHYAPTDCTVYVVGPCRFFFIHLYICDDVYVSHRTSCLFSDEMVFFF